MNLGKTQKEILYYLNSSSGITKAFLYLYCKGSQSAIDSSLTRLIKRDIVVYKEYGSYNFYYLTKKAIL